MTTPTVRVIGPSEFTPITDTASVRVLGSTEFKPVTTGNISLPTLSVKAVDAKSFEVSDDLNPGVYWLILSSRRRTEAEMAEAIRASWTDYATSRQGMGWGHAHTNPLLEWAQTTYARTLALRGISFPVIENRGCRFQGREPRARG